MKNILYASNDKEEYIVTDINLEKGVFKGFYKDFNESKHFIDDKISNYEFYDSSTSVDDMFDLEMWLEG